MMEGLPHQLAEFKHALLMLPIAALLGAALGVLRPIRRSLVPRPHIGCTQIAPFLRIHWGRMNAAVFRVCQRPAGNVR